jgi:hypothetical protein
MIKKIREEKTYMEDLNKTGIQEALGDLNKGSGGRSGSNPLSKAELENTWIRELVQRKKEEIDRKEELK